MADFLSLICFVLALVFAWQYREEERKKAERKLKGLSENRIYDINRIVKQDIRNEIETNFKKEEAKRNGVSI